jgi:hypothetical protein
LTFGHMAGFDIDIASSLVIQCKLVRAKK